MKEMVGGCCVCSDERGWPENPLVYCDGQGCTVAVHQACYGIVTVPTGPWYCRKCESQERAARVRCELCPSRDGALKRTDGSGWAHVVCALYIPEVRFGNVTTMEPIILQLIPMERFNKSCYICEELGKPARSNIGACMQCNRSGCKQQFHVTCAQGLGLLCEEAGNYLDNVKYCGYCQHHYGKLKKGANVKVIPPYKPVKNTAAGGSGDSTPEKEGEGNAAATKSGPRRKGSTSAGAAKSTPHMAMPPHGASKPSKSTPSTSMEAPSGPPGGAPSHAPATDTPNKTETPVQSSSSQQQQHKESTGKNSGKKRKAGSRTPTPNPNMATVGEEKGAQAQQVVGPTEGVVAVDKPKKAKTEHANGATSGGRSNASPHVAVPTTESASQPGESTPVASQTSLVVSVPLASAALSPIAANVALHADAASRLADVIATAGPNPNGSSSGAPPSTAATDPPREATPQPVPPPRSQSADFKPDKPTEKTEKSRKQKRNSNPNPNGATHGTVSTGPSSAPPPTTSQNSSKRSSRSQNVNISGSSGLLEKGERLIASVKESPPSSPSGDDSNLGSQKSVGRRPKNRGRQGSPTVVGKMQQAQQQQSGVSQQVQHPAKDVKIFQNGIHAPHMLGNQLNPNSNMAQKMSDHLHSELEAHSIFSQDIQAPMSLIGPQLHSRVLSSTRSNASSSSSSNNSNNSNSNSSNLSSMLGGVPQTLDQLLERQWEQGSQFLMEQAQHFDIASLLSCLHQLRAENLRLEEHVNNLLQRRDHLLAVNARLAIPLTTGQQQQRQPQSYAGLENGIGPSARFVAQHTQHHSASAAAPANSSSSSSSMTGGNSSSTGGNVTNSAATNTKGS